MMPKYGELELLIKKKVLGGGGGGRALGRIRVKGDIIEKIGTH